MDKILSVFKSRRAYAVASAILVAVLQEGLGVDPKTALIIAGGFLTWALGDSLRKTE